MNPALRITLPGLRLRRLNRMPVILIATLLGLLIYSCETLGYVDKLSPLLLSSFWASFLAYLLNKTRWKAWVSLLYGLTASLAFACQTVATIIPLQINLGFENWLQQANWQMFLFIERISAWGQSLLSSRAVYDDGFTAAMTIIYVWIGSFWLVFFFLRLKNAWLPLLPLLVQVTLNVHYGKLSSLLLLTSLVFAYCLVASRYYGNQQHQWVQGKLDFPDELWLEWAVSALLITVLVVTLANFAPAVTTREGWQKISDWFEEVRTASQPPVAQGPVISSITSSSNTGGGGSELIRIQPPDVTLVGTPLVQKEGTAMWVRVSDPTPRHWRMAIYTSYTGRGWEEAVPDQSTRDSSISTQIPTGRKVLIQEFVLEENFGIRLFAASEPAQPLSDKLSIQRMYPEGSGILYGSLRRYQILSWVSDVNEEELRTDSGSVPPEISRVYTQLPDTLPERVRTLVARLEKDHPNRFDFTVAVQNYLRDSVPYDLNTPLPEADQDVVDYFLFEAPSGFCSYYASAMVVILRTQNIPARIVTGFASGTYQEEEGYFYVPLKAVHAWVEVYFPSYGWITFEPTPSQVVPDFSIAAETTPPLSPQLTFLQARRWLTALWTTIALVVVLLIWLMIRWIWKLNKNQRILRKEQLHPAVYTYRKLRFQLADAGLPLIGTQTPYEFYEHCGVQLANYPQLLEVINLSTRLYVKSMYSASEPESEAMIQLKNRFRQSFSERLRLWSIFNRRKLAGRIFRKKQH